MNLPQSIIKTADDDAITRDFDAAGDYVDLATMTSLSACVPWFL